MTGFRRLGDPFGGFYRLSGLGKGQNPGFNWQDFLTFEAGTTTPRPTGWDAVETGAAGSVAASAAAAYQGNFGFATTLVGAGDIANGRLKTPNSDKEATLSLLININNLSMGAFEAFRGIIAVDAGPAAVPRAFEVGIREAGGPIILRAFAFTNAGLNTGFTDQAIAPGWHKLDLFFKASDVGLDNGYFKFVYDGAEVSHIQNIANSDYQIDGIQVGARETVDAGTSGTMFFDNIGYAPNVKRY